MKTKIYEPSEIAKKSYFDIVNATSRITVLEGAIRSSKTYTANMAKIKRHTMLPPCDILVSGATSGSVARNVIAEWARVLGAWRFRTKKDGKDEYLHINYPGLSDKKYYVRGAAKINDADQIQGATYGDWLGDEITLHHQKFTDMASSRLSLPFSSATWTTNPDGPLHYIKTEWLDNKLLNDGGKITVNHFSLDDNPSLTDEYKESLRLSYSGVFYDRYVLGKWVKAEGLVYPNFDRNRHVVKSVPKRYDKLTVSVDAGTLNACVFLLSGSIGDKRYFLDEYYHDGRKDGQKTNAQYRQDMEEFFAKNGISRSVQIVIDPSAADLKLELLNSGFDVVGANNNVLKGIQKCSSLISRESIFILDRCKHTIDEFLMYAWDEKKSLLTGKDEVIKQHDHCMDAFRYAVCTIQGGLT